MVQRIETNGFASRNDIKTNIIATNGSPSGDVISNGHALPDANAYAEPIAIVGMAMRLPGGIRDSKSLWDFLVNKKSAQCRVPPSRYNIDAFYGPAGKPGCVGSQTGYFLEDVDLANLDASFWSVTKQEAEAMDPQQRLLLEVVYECLENAGVKEWRGHNIGCYAGSFGEDWLDMELKDDENANMYRMPGYSDFVLSNRVSYEFDFRGPSMTIRTACSSSLTGLHEACLALARGDCEAAIVGGTSVITAPRMTVALTDQGVISPTGSCKTFDANADGYARGEGVSAVYVKRMSDAIRDGDSIRAIIRSTAVNSDGKTPGLTMPSTQGHEAVMRRAYEAAGISDFSKTAMIECHGTGTKVGDPIETKAVGNVFGAHGLYIGSIKPNLGHSEGNSGLSSVIKMVLALENKTIPPNINFCTPNPNIPLKEAKLSVPIEAMPWPENKAERVGVNSFGIGGANAHVILESLECYGNARQTNGTDGATLDDCSPRTDSRLLVFSAKHPDALRDIVKTHEAYALGNPSALGDMSYSLGSRRHIHEHKAFCVATPSSSFEMFPVAGASGATSSLVYMFTGQGAQWAQMGKELFEEHAVFREAIHGLDLVLSNLLEPPPWTLREQILLPKHKSRLSEAEFSQPCCTAIQIALVDLLAQFGVSPSAVIGHSSGEIAAAYACEAISAEEAILIAYHRGQATKGIGQTYHGGMAAIGLGRSELTPYLLPGVIIGCENSPASVTITGDMDILEQVMQSVQTDFPDVLVRSLRVECAYHSHHMTLVADKYLASMVDMVHAKAPKVPLYSSVTGQIIGGADDLSAHYWVQNLLSPVLFYPAVALLLDTIAAVKVFLEIGPHSALAGPIRQIIREHPKSQGADYAATLTRNGNASVDLLNTVGQLWIRNIDIDFRGIIPKGRFLDDLPLYPWHYEGKYWAESRLSREWRLRKFPRHDILGTRVIQSTNINPSWRNVLRLENVPWIRDHEIGGDILLPGAAFIAMAGEAIRQISGGTSDDYTVRNVTISTALILQETVAVELITNLRLVRLTTTLDSCWFDFTVSSLRDETWTTHISGQVRAGSEYSPTVIRSQPAMDPLPRKVLSSTWYRAMRRVGMNYGPRFRPLTEISSHVTEERAVAKLAQAEPDCTETAYQLHPTSLDAAFQLFTTAASKGIPRRFNQLLVPTFIDELYISHYEGEIDMAANVASNLGGILSGNLIAISGGKTVIDLKGLRLSPLGDSISTNQYVAMSDSINEHNGVDSHAAVEIQWDRHIDFVDAASLMRPAQDISDEHMLLEKFALACMIETSVQLQDRKRTSIPHLEKFSLWLTRQREAALAGNYPNIIQCEDLASMISAQRIEIIQDLYQQLSKTGASSVSTAVHRIFLAGEGIWDGTVDPLDILLEDNVLTKVYDYMQLWEYGDYFKLLAHSKPNLRILEIGAGTGGTTSTILPFLTSESYGERMYASYTYTDVSPGFFVGAKERFKNVPAMEYAVLDISKDPLCQGFEAETFDLIVACNVLHATPCLRETLKNVRTLLHPRGRLLLQELSPTTKWINYVMGVLSGWWLGGPDGRTEEPYVTVERWDCELKSAGFGGVKAAAFDGQLNNNIISMPACSYHQLHCERRVTLLQGASSGTPTVSTTVVEKQLRQQGYMIDFCTLYDIPAPQQVIISLLDLDAPFLHNVTAEEFLTFRNFLNHVTDTGLIWVTGASQINCHDPRYSLILGTARTLRSELQMDLATLELETFEIDRAAEWAAVITDVLHEFEHRIHETDMGPTLEYVWDKGAVQVGKFHWVNVPKSLLASTDESLPKQLQIARPGVLQTLNWVQNAEPLPALVEDQIELRVQAVGLNFKDVLIAMGIVENGVNGLGCECSGIVTKVALGVKDLKVGDRVMSIAPGSFATTLSTSEKLCAKMPDSLSFVEGATIPCVYATVIYSLINLARLQKSQTVLVHSACGGVGMSAVQVAKMVGAEIYCTVGNQEKIEILVERFGISRDHIFNSRDTSFLPGIMTSTDGKGVDVVLNSLSGELLHASWKCVAQFGVMIEIGKRDFIGKAALSMDLFEENRSFMGVDLSQICTHRPALMFSLLQQAILFLKAGSIKPISPIKAFEAHDVEGAFRYLQKGQHIGKVVLTVPNVWTEKNNITKVARQQKQLRVRPDRAYLLVGGLGGLGKSVASWLVEKGARHLIFFSRTAGATSTDDAYFLELKAQGCLVQAFSGSVVETTDVIKVVRMAGKLIGGIFQASMVLKDGPMKDMTFDQWQTATKPKIQGTWNLHKVLLRQSEPLDFFFLFSSISGLAGQPGQANYASGNAFLDAFVQYRHSLGLTASVLDIGAMGDVGYLSQNTETLESLRATALHVLQEQELLDSLYLMLLRSAPRTRSESGTKMQQQNENTGGNAAHGFVNQSQMGIGIRSSLPLAAKNNRTLWKRDPRMAVYRNLEAQDTATSHSSADSNSSLKSFLASSKADPASLSADESVAFLAKITGETLCSFMMRSSKDIDLDTPLAALGVDSLVSIELRNWLRLNIGAEFTVLEIVGSGTLIGLGAKTAEKLRLKFS